MKKFIGFLHRDKHKGKPYVFLDTLFQEEGGSVYFAHAMTDTQGPYSKNETDWIPRVPKEDSGITQEVINHELSFLQKLPNELHRKIIPGETLIIHALTICQEYYLRLPSELQNQVFKNENGYFIFGDSTELVIFKDFFEQNNIPYNRMI